MSISPFESIAECMFIASGSVSDTSADERWRDRWWAARLGDFWKIWKHLNVSKKRIPWQVDLSRLLTFGKYSIQIEIVIVTWHRMKYSVKMWSGWSSGWDQKECLMMYMRKETIVSRIMAMDSVTFSSYTSFCALRILYVRYTPLRRNNSSPEKAVKNDVYFKNDNKQTYRFPWRSPRPFADRRSTWVHFVHTFHQEYSC